MGLEPGALDKVVAQLKSGLRVYFQAFIFHFWSRA